MPRAPQNQLAVARGQGVVIVRVIGSGNMISAPTLNDFAEASIGAGYKRFVFDLSQCRGLDSTFMGCMVGICTAIRKDSSSDEPGLLLSPEDAVALLKKSFNTGELAADSPEPLVGEGFVAAVNVSQENVELLGILGVDKFVRVLGGVDLSPIEATLLPETLSSSDKRRALILKAHENLVEIDKRNEAQFGAFLKTLSAELAKNKPSDA